MAEGGEEMLLVIIVVSLILVVLVLLLVDALVNDSDPVTHAPGSEIDAAGDAGALPAPPPERKRPAQQTQTVPDELSREASERRLARNLRDPELRKIPPLLFSEPMPERPERDSVKVLFPRPPMPLLIPPEREGSMVEQIDGILQENIAGTPLAQCDICLVEIPTKGVIVRVGSQMFEGIDAVTDPDVKAAVQAAAAQWEAEQ